MKKIPSALPKFLQIYANKDQTHLTDLIKSNSGFTLLEIIITLTIISVLLLVSFPYFRTIITRNQTAVTINKLISAINYTRNEAIKLHTTVTFCGSSDHQSCDGNWTAGQIVINTQQQQILRIYPMLPKPAYLTWRSNFGKKELLQFTETGFTNGQKGSFIYCPGNNNLEFARTIVVDFAGHIRATKQDSQQQPFKCPL